MFLFKRIVNPANGAAATYWKTKSIFWDAEAQNAIYTINGWVDKAAYEGGIAPVHSFIFNVPGGYNPQFGAQANALLLGFAMSQSEFSNARLVNE
jgi:hypothetical protein